MPESTREVISDFLAQKRIAVVGVSRNPKDFNTGLFRDLRKSGYDAVPVNPGASEIEGVPCYARVQDIQPPADAALVMTKPELTDKVVSDCHEAGIGRVWLYRATGKGAVTPSAIEFCAQNNMRVVPGFCPYMFLPQTPWFHRFHGFLLRIVGKYPA